VRPSILKLHGRRQAQREFEVKDRLRRPPQAAALRALLELKFSLRSNVAVRFKEDSAPTVKLHLICLLPFLLEFCFNPQPAVANWYDRDGKKLFE
jgi:hypothetical protein